VALHECEWCGLDLYQRGPGTRQHVDLRSTVCPWQFPATSTALACSPRVDGAALCIIQPRDAS